MVELIRTNDPVLLSWLTARLARENIEAIVLDTHASVVEGSLVAIQRRVMVKDDDLSRAKRLLDQAEAIETGEGYGFD
mgnify:FL=1